MKRLLALLRSLLEVFEPRAHGHDWISRADADGNITIVPGGPR